MPADPLQTQLDIQALKIGQEEDRKVLNKVSDSLDQLVNMQKAHEIFHEKVNGKFIAVEKDKIEIDKRFVKLESNQLWLTRIFIGAIVVKLLSLLWT